jgi:hypothetical protein
MSHAYYVRLGLSSPRHAMPRRRRPFSVPLLPGPLLSCPLLSFRPAAAKKNAKYGNHVNPSPYLAFKADGGMGTFWLPVAGNAHEYHEARNRTTCRRQARRFRRSPEGSETSPRNQPGVERIYPRRYRSCQPVPSGRRLKPLLYLRELEPGIYGTVGGCPFLSAAGEDRDPLPQPRTAPAPSPFPRR